MPYVITDKTTKLAVAIGCHAVHNQNGKLVRDEETASGATVQHKFQTALGLGEWDSCLRLTYDGVDIPSQNYEFYGNGAAAGASALFPTDVAHPGAAHINVNLPVGMATDGQPDKAVGLYKTSKLADYNAAGAQIGFAYSANPARAAVHIIKLLAGSASLIDFGSFAEYRDWCDAPIAYTKDGATVLIPRFESHLFFMPPFGLKDALDRITSLSCTDWTWAKGKIRFLPALDREPVFDFDLTKISSNYLDFSFQAQKKKNRPNGVRVAWRDLDDPLLKEQDPVVIRREDLIAADDGLENFFELSVGVARRSQVERIGNYYARLKCDLTDFAFINKSAGSWKSYVTLPGDIVTLTHPVPAWNGKRCKIIKKTEDEDKGIGYPHYVQLEPSNPYSDDDHTPLVTRTAVTGPNPYSAPPLPLLTLAQDSGLASDGSTFNQLIGTITFGAFAFGQTAKIYWMKPGAGYKFLADAKPDANNSATFYALNPPDGVNYFKIVPISELNVFNANVSPLNEKSISVAASTFYVDGQPVSLGVFRAKTGLNPDGDYKGRDLGAVPAAAISARIDSAEVVNDSVYTTIAVQLAEFTGGAFNNIDSATRLEIDVFDQFGNFIKPFPPGVINFGTGQAITSHSRKYADPKDGQAYFRIKVKNKFGYSNVVYLKGSSVTAAVPAPLILANCPRELAASPISPNVIQLSFQTSVGCNLYRRAPGAAAWILHDTGLAGSPANETGFSESTDYELQLRWNADETYRSNIVRIRTKQQGEAAPLRPAPSALSGAPDSSSPATQINISWSRNANDNAGVEVWKDGNPYDTVAANQTWYYFGGSGAGTAHSFKVRNKWGTNDCSAFSNEISVATQSPPPAAQPPEITSANYDTGAQAANVYFTAHGGSGTFLVDRRLPGGSWTRIIDGLSAAATGFSNGVAQSTAGDQTVYYRVGRSDVSGFGNEFPVTVPINPTAPGGGGYGGGGCFAGWTPFNLTLAESIPMAELYRRRAEFTGTEVLSFDAANNHTQRRILSVHRVKSNKFVVARFGNGLKRKVTPTHRFWTAAKKFVSICDLKPGDKIYDKNRQLVEITSIKLKTVKNAQWWI